MFELTVYSVVALAVVFFLGHSRLTFQPRKWLSQQGKAGRWFVSLLQCAGCCGFWLGVAAAVFGYGPASLYTSTWLGILLCGLYTSGASLILGGLAGLGSDEELA